MRDLGRLATCLLSHRNRLFIAESKLVYACWPVFICFGHSLFSNAFV